MSQPSDYLEQFGRLQKEAKQPAWMFPLRRAGMARFAELGFPTTREEDWRFTNVAPIAQLPFNPVFELSSPLRPEQVAGFTFGKLPVNLQCQAFYNVQRPDYAPEWSLRLQMQLLLPASMLR